MTFDEEQKIDEDESVEQPIHYVFERSDFSDTEWEELVDSVSVIEEFLKQDAEFSEYLPKIKEKQPFFLKASYYLIHLLIAKEVFLLREFNSELTLKEAVFTAMGHISIDINLNFLPTIYHIDVIEEKMYVWSLLDIFESDGCDMFSYEDCTFYQYLMSDGLSDDTPGLSDDIEAVLPRAVENFTFRDSENADVLFYEHFNKILDPEHQLKEVLEDSDSKGKKVGYKIHTLDVVSTMAEVLMSMFSFREKL